MLIAKQSRKANTAPPVSRAAKAELAFSRRGHGTSGVARHATRATNTATADKKKNAVDTYLRAAVPSFRPCDSDIAFNRPLPMPKSANVNTEKADVMVIQTPNRSAPK